MPNKKSIAEWRSEIDRIDEQLVKLLAERQRIVEHIIGVKKATNLPARIPARIDHVLDHVRALAVNYKVDPQLIETIWTEMVEWFIAHEERQLGS